MLRDRAVERDGQSPLPSSKPVVSPGDRGWEDRSRVLRLEPIELGTDVVQSQLDASAQFISWRPLVIDVGWARVPRSVTGNRELDRPGLAVVGHPNGCRAGIVVLDYSGPANQPKTSQAGDQSLPNQSG